MTASEQKSLWSLALPLKRSGKDMTNWTLLLLIASARCRLVVSWWSGTRPKAPGKSIRSTPVFTSVFGSASPSERPPEQNRDLHPLLMLQGAQSLRDRPIRSGSDLHARLHPSNKQSLSSTYGLYPVVGIRISVNRTCSCPQGAHRSVRTNDYKAARQGQSPHGATSKEVRKGRDAKAPT